MLGCSTGAGRTVGADEEVADTVGLLSKSDRLMVMAESDGGNERGLGKVGCCRCWRLNAKSWWWQGSWGRNSGWWWQG
jgi:hypothetical protein